MELALNIPTVEGDHCCDRNDEMKMMTPSARQCEAVTLGCLRWTDKEAMSAATVGCFSSFFSA